MQTSQSSTAAKTQVAMAAAHGSRVRHAVIIAAGSGMRFGRATHFTPKPLLRLAGVPLIMRAIQTVRKAGITSFTVVTGYRGEVIEEYLAREAPPDIRVTCVRNDKWQRPNGWSAFRAAEDAPEQFLLLMADHVFEPSIIGALTREPLPQGRCRLAVDRRVNAVADLDDATKAEVRGGLIHDIGKEIPSYNAIDTGVFLCSRALFDALERSLATGRESLSDGIRALAEKGVMEAVDIEGRFWQDVDNQGDLALAERRLLETLRKSKDSWITRHVNRRISLSLTRRLARTPVTPNAITLFNLGVGLLGSVCMLAGTRWWQSLGAFLFLASSILDGCDGEIARLKFMQTRLGAMLDVTTDNITHVTLFLCLTVGIVNATGSVLPILPGSLLLLGVGAGFGLSLAAKRFLSGKGGVIFAEKRLQDIPAAPARGHLSNLLDRVANRDFAYLLLALALAGHAGWFLWIAGLGAPIFAFLLGRTVFRLSRMARGCADDPA